MKGSALCYPPNLFRVMLWYSCYSSCFSFLLPSYRKSLGTSSQTLPFPTLNPSFSIYNCQSWKKELPYPRWQFEKQLLKVLLTKEDHDTGKLRLNNTAAWMFQAQEIVTTPKWSMGGREFLQVALAGTSQREDMGSQWSSPGGQLPRHRGGAGGQWADLKGRWKMGSTIS